MLYFIDTEFIENTTKQINRSTIDLISIGIVREDGKEFYAESNEFIPDSASEWVKKNVYPNLIYNPYLVGDDDYQIITNSDSLTVLGSREQIKTHLLEYIGHEVPTFWGFSSSYDWVVLCQLFGRMIDLPKHWPKHCNDIKTLEEIVMFESNIGSISRIPDEPIKHDAIFDARWNKKYFDMLIEIRKGNTSK